MEREREGERERDYALGLYASLRRSASVSVAPRMRPKTA